MGVWNNIRDTLASHGKAALVSVVRTAGSAPRESGARLVVRPDGGFYGTVGGGRLELEVLAVAQAALATDGTTARAQIGLRTWTLGPDLSQCCGGVVTTLMEVFDQRDQEAVAALAKAEAAGPFTTVSRLGADGRVSRVLAFDPVDAPPPGRKPEPDAPFVENFGEAFTPVLVFGAGHVGRALILALAPLPFAVRWIDTRAEQFPSHVPANVVPVHATEPEREIDEAPEGAFVLVLTYAHALDYSIAARALARNVFPYVGMIGSSTKRARFESHAQKLGMSHDVIRSLVCPIGIPDIFGKTPPVIAAAVAAQLLIKREQMPT